MAPRRSPPADHVHTARADPSELRAKGRRLTRQRQLIWDAFAAEPEQHLSADDLVERVRAELPQVSASTIYRTLDLLVHEGLLLRTNLGGDRAYYELAHDHAHHHLVCERCGAVQHLHEEQLGDLRERLRTTAGFTLGAGEITLFGLCGACGAAP
ncbi:MAG TPA: transcriptional repressor [Gaiellaceae bacterium]|jgi:Fur family ferric uptake transcriptional regulator